MVSFGHQAFEVRLWNATRAEWVHEENTVNDVWFIMKFLFTLLKVFRLYIHHQMHCDSGSFHFSTTLFFCSFLFSQYISFVANFDCYDYTLWMCSASECLCVCECFFLVWLVTAFKSVLLFQLKIIYFRVQWVSYQQKRFSYFGCVRARFLVDVFFLCPFFGNLVVGQKSCWKIQCTDTSKNVLAFLMENCMPDARSVFFSEMSIFSAPQC